MNTQIIQELLRVLKPVIKNQRKAEQLLVRYAQGKVIIIWSIQDVYRAANERGLALTLQEAREVLHAHSQTHNKQYGMRWEHLTDYIQDRVLGRKLTRKEINRFVKEDIITINR